ncbi:DMT family transporter [Janibacter sp. GXQ6167]|uniref:DMT family transporter n=1 Tax=Janibacter sp. GXQ6167 TaxID=3240791 RepID=UPI003524F1C2
MSIPVELPSSDRRRRWPDPSHPVLLVVIGGILFGTAGTAQAYAPVEAAAPAIGSVRLLGGALALTAYLAMRGYRLSGLIEIWRSKAGVVAALGAGLFQPLFFSGIERTSVPLGTLVTVGSAPVFTGLLAWALFRDRPTPIWGAATALCILGLGLLTGFGTAGGSALGVLMNAGAGLAIASFTVAAKTLLARGRGTIEILAAAFLLGSVVVVPPTLFTDLSWLATPRGAAVAVWLGIATMAAANIFYARGLGRLPAPTTATLALTDPLTATLLGVFVLGQALTVAGWAGVAVLLLGLLVQGAFASNRKAQASDIGRTASAPAQQP